MNSTGLEKKIVALRRTLSWMDLVMANVDECILVLDTEWRVVFANSYLAEILNQNRIALLGKHVWEILPFLDSAVHSDSKPLTIKDVNSIEGVYDFPIHNLSRKLLFHGSYIDYLDQAVCIISDVSMELKAEDALMALDKEVASLRAQLIDKM